MNKIYLGNQVIVDLSGYYDKTAIDASFGALDTSIADAYDSLDNLEDVSGGLASDFLLRRYVRIDSTYASPDVVPMRMFPFPSSSKQRTDEDGSPSLYV